MPHLVRARVVSPARAAARARRALATLSRPVARYRRSLQPRHLSTFKRWLADGHSSNWATTDAICGSLVGPAPLLREAGEADPDRLERYLRAGGRKIPRTTVRYAIERFPPRKRRDLLETTRSRPGPPQSAG
jgi:hypothetical protein